jgi:trehalose 6-phosphate synthase
MSRLVVLSNRLPLGSGGAGGLQVALQDALAEGGLWIGNSGKVVAHPSDTLDAHVGAPYARLSFDLSTSEHATYYLGYANSVLWPLCHARADLLDLKPEYLEGYRAVNARIARLTAARIRPGDRIWVHDYHLLPIAHELQALGIDNPIGFFLHIPFPGPMDFRALPNGVEVARWIAAYHLFGVQTQRDVAACFDVFRHLPGAQILLNGRLSLHGAQVRVASFPIGIDTDGFARTAAAAEPVPGLPRNLVIGVDRLDYSKGLPQRFRAFAHLLEARPDLAGQVELLQIAPPTRDTLAAYQNIRAELEQLAGQINGEHADLTWTPIRFIHRAVARERLAGLYRQARVGLVTPLADGMNLVAKEYVAAQDPEDPGVLVLSRFAGAVAQMSEALIVNPHDAAEVADAIAQALTMPLDERRARHAPMMERLRRQDVAWWRDSFLRHLDSAARVAATQPAPAGTRPAPGLRATPEPQV